MEDFSRLIDRDDAGPSNAAARQNSVASGARALWATTVFLALATIMVRWPGSLIADSQIQLEQIRSGLITDWHPPVMAIIWRSLGETPQSMLVLQVILYWAGLGLLADQLRRGGAGRLSFGMLLVGLTPISVLYLGVVQKDTLLTSLFVLTAGLCTRFNWLGGLAPGFVAALTRANAVFAMPPLLFRTRSLASTAILCVAFSVALIPVSRYINHHVLNAEPSHVEKSLLLFDLAGIERYSGREFVGRSISRCYTPFYWDTLALDCQAFDRTVDDLTSNWINAVAAEPVAYAKHRLSHFNNATFFLVPPIQECVFVPKHHDCATGDQQLLKDALTRNAFLWPVTWLLVGVLLLFMRLDAPAQMLTLSAVLYGFAYLIVGVATGFRYFYWTQFAVQVAIFWQLATGGLPHWRRIVLAVLGLWVVGYTYRYGPLLL